MAHWPEDQRPEWPHLEHGSIGRLTLVPKDGRVQCTSVLDIPHLGPRWLPLGVPTKIFPETRPPLVNLQEHSTRQRTEEGMQYIRTHFPDADFPGELLRNEMETEAMGMHRLESFDPFLGNLLAVIPSHHAQNESVALFPMGELGRELNISRLAFDSPGNAVFIPAGSPTFVLETPILQISSVIDSSAWIATPYSTLLIRTHASSSLFRLERSKFTRELDITRSEVGDVPIMDSRILASGPDIIVVNRDGKIYKCNTYHGGKAMQLIGGREDSVENDFWQLGVTRRNDECFVTSCKAVKHVDLRSASSFADVFSLDSPSEIVTSFESPVHDYISRVTTTSNVVWLDDRFRGRPLLSHKHYRSSDRTLRILTANIFSASLSLLMSRRNGLVTLYDVNRGSDKLLHCNSVPSCLPRDGSMSTTFDGHALFMLPSNKEFAFLRLCRRGSIHRQDIRVVQPDEERSSTDDERRATHQWDEDVQRLATQANDLRIDVGPAGGRRYIQVDFRGVYQELCITGDDTQEDTNQNTFEETVARLREVWKATEETEGMLTTFDAISGTEVGSKQTHLSGYKFNAKQALETMVHGDFNVQELVGLARWHFSLRNTSVPAVKHNSLDYNALHERLKGSNLVSGNGRHDSSVRREREARERLVLDLALSNDVYSAKPITMTSATRGATSVERSYGEEPPEVKFGYFRPVAKTGADHYANKKVDDGQDQAISSPLGVRLLLAEWELGTDPEGYVYRDPYGVVDVEVQPIPQHRRWPTAQPTTQKKQTQPQRPPAVISTQQPPAAANDTVEHPQAHSQPLLEPDLEAFSFSQAPMTSTQVLPGPFGGRPGVGKKLAKKRIGGF